MVCVDLDGFVKPLPSIRSTERFVAAMKKRGFTLVDYMRSEGGSRRDMWFGIKNCVNVGERGTRLGFLVSGGICGYASPSLFSHGRPPRKRGGRQDGYSSKVINLPNFQAPRCVEARWRW